MHYQGQIGRWPKNCRDCQVRKDREHNTNAKHRMRRRRAELKERAPKLVTTTADGRRCKPMSQQTALQQRRYTLGPDVETTRFFRLCRDRGMREPEKHQVSDAPE
jgi:hypothetical protein